MGELRQRPAHTPERRVRSTDRRRGSAVAHIERSARRLQISLGLFTLVVVLAVAAQSYNAQRRAVSDQRKACSAQVALRAVAVRFYYDDYLSRRSLAHPSNLDMELAVQALAAARAYNRRLPANLAIPSLGPGLLDCTQEFREPSPFPF